eukprot:201484-Chlamydomonas_euryale.AAC.2
MPDPASAPLLSAPRTAAHGAPRCRRAGRAGRARDDADHDLPRRPSAAQHRHAATAEAAAMRGSTRGAVHGNGTGFATSAGKADCRRRRGCRRRSSRRWRRAGGQAATESRGLTRSKSNANACAHVQRKMAGSEGLLCVAAGGALARVGKIMVATTK